MTAGEGPAERQRRKTQLAPLIDQARDRMRALARTVVPDADVWHLGAFEYGPQFLAFTVIVQTDAERRRLEGTPGFLEQLREVLRGTGYPPEAVPAVGLGFASQETCDRDFNGNWYYFFK